MRRYNTADIAVALLHYKAVLWTLLIYGEMTTMCGSAAASYSAPVGAVFAMHDVTNNTEGLEHAVMRATAMLARARHVK